MSVDGWAETSTSLEIVDDDRILMYMTRNTMQQAFHSCAELPDLVTQFAAALCDMPIDERTRIAREFWENTLDLWEMELSNIDAMSVLPDISLAPAIDLQTQSAVLPNVIHWVCVDAAFAAYAGVDVSFPPGCKLTEYLENMHAHATDAEREFFKALTAQQMNALSPLGAFIPGQECSFQDNIATMANSMQGALATVFAMQTGEYVMAMIRSRREKERECILFRLPFDLFRRVFMVMVNAHIPAREMDGAVFGPLVLKSFQDK